MAKTGDVMFTKDAVDYNFMLATDEGNRKYWDVQPDYSQPPSLVKQRIEMVIKAAPKVRLADGTTIVTNNDVATVMGQIETLYGSPETPMALSGYDDISYNVILPEQCARAKAVRDASGRITEYDIALRCLGQYVSA